MQFSNRVCDSYELTGAEKPALLPLGATPCQFDCWVGHMEMASHQVSTSADVEDAGPENHPLSRECALKLVTGFLTDVSVTMDGPPVVRSGSLDWTTWQLLDSLFPTGGFAHSYGLETAYQGGLVCDAVSLERFAMSSLQNTAGMLLPFVFAGNKFPNTECWLELNKILHAVLTNHVARKASLTQGSALLRTASTVFTECHELKKMRACTYAPPATTPHHAPLFGVLCGLLGVDAVTAQRSYLFMGLRDILSAATRLNITGPLEAAKLQHQIAGVTETLLTRYANRPLGDSYSTHPLLDTFQGAHDQLFSRMFCS